MMVNEFKISGKLVKMQVFPASIKTLGILVEGQFNGVAQFYPMFCYESLVDVICGNYKVGDAVTVTGGLRYFTKSRKVDLIAFSIKHNQNAPIEVKKINSKDSKRDEKNGENQLPIPNGSIKQISMMDGSVIQEYESIRDAAKAVKVKKSALERAINENRPLSEFIWSR